MSRGEYLTELRRSNASGMHGHRRPRGIVEDEAISESISSYGALLDRTGLRDTEKGENLLDVYPYPDDYDSELEPSEEELIAIDREYTETLSSYDDRHSDWEDDYPREREYEE